ncbi:DUF6286 domain-containing protein [Cryptosporangium japonicum]|uniref:DUF6286 domain-containing protein n=1 Tax=Cryptosporangium japonicum TaxID=80872 RepID=A0ABN0TS15_9ACTN
MTTPGERAPARLVRGPIGVAGPLLATVLLVVGVVLARDGLVAGGLLGGRATVPALLDAAGRLTARSWLIPVGAGLALVGLGLVYAAVRPRPRRGIPVDSATGLYLTADGVARLASDAAGEVGGVLSARTSAGRRRVVTTVEATTDDPTLADAVTRAVSARLAHLRTPPAVRVRLRAPRADSRRVL